MTHERELKVPLSVIIILSTVIGAPLCAFGQGGLRVLGGMFFALWLVSTVLALMLDRKAGP